MVTSTVASQMLCMGPGPLQTGAGFHKAWKTKPPRMAACALARNTSHTWHAWRCEQHLAAGHSTAGYRKAKLEIAKASPSWTQVHVQSRPVIGSLRFTGRTSSERNTRSHTGRTSMRQSGTGISWEAANCETSEARKSQPRALAQRKPAHRTRHQRCTVKAGPPRCQTQTPHKEFDAHCLAEKPWLRKLLSISRYLASQMCSESDVPYTVSLSYKTSFTERSAKAAWN